MSESIAPRIADLQAIAALAHPRRSQILERLHLGGPATSAMLARDLGLNTGATSYHLRELAAGGFVVEVPERSGGRQRWWRVAAQDLRFPPRSEQSPEMRQAFDEMNRIGLAADLEDMARAYHASAPDGDEWSDAFLYSRGTIDVSIAELREFFDEYIALVKRYQRPPDIRPGGTRTMYTRFFSHPAPPLSPPAS